MGSYLNFGSSANHGYLRAEHHVVQLGDNLSAYMYYLELRLTYLGLIESAQSRLDISHSFTCFFSTESVQSPWGSIRHDHTCTRLRLLGYKLSAVLGASKTPSHINQHCGYRLLGSW